MDRRHFIKTALAGLSALVAGLHPKDVKGNEGSGSILICSHL